MTAINEWWDGLETAMKLFYGIAFVSTTVMTLQTILTLIGIDSDHDIGGDHGDFGGDHGGDHGDSDVSVLSVRTVIAFLVGFGWTGAIFRDMGWALILVLPIALLVGGGLMAFVFWFMRFLHGLRESGNIDYVYAMGEIGTVYLPIPPAREKAGKIEVMVQGRLSIVDAYTSSEKRIGNREKVRVIDVIGTDALLVEPVNE